MTRKRARGTTMLDKLQTISEATIKEEPKAQPLPTQHCPPTWANPNLDEKFVQPQLTRTRFGLVGSSNQSVLYTPSSIQAGLQVIGDTSNTLSGVGSDILGSKTYSSGKHGLIDASKFESSNVSRAFSVLKGNGATNSRRLSGSS
ncbi:hypothetical protein ACH5RR_013083 [Cinchona calisaya]|uniref:Uncharacterized protein n=1 Tax=Cinchona calisaya TaxID=153742 RepID=A0ABD3A184_9GENT